MSGLPAVPTTYERRPVDIRSRNFHLRLAETPEEVAASQALRYQVFVQEMAAQPTPERQTEQREFDRFDPFCDHLLVFDTDADPAPGRVIATYRFMRREAALRAGGFYTATEYDIGPLEAYHGEAMELGRSCVHADYRAGANMQLVWRGITDYVMHFGVDLMFGCASLPTVEPAEVAEQLTYLYYHHLAPPGLRPRARPELHVKMDRLSPEAVDAKAALQALPPLIKGYLRLGGFVGDGAVIDSDFGTTDVCVVVKTDMVTDRYRRHLTRERTTED
ncbi:GNAT family N-acetyltransferase [Algihabitans albus]|uniref:GNAT family N-acetyltransferase n=1 Tax=Algihabitans albus TaxID=2164067 RepID=UPI001F38AD62|nr:GNAT family N-acyltransferase [Algihabitans albus]